ncbi:MAG: RHS repeat-associated core domain-containing protein [Dehalococcoidales bacterium]
MLAHTLNTSVEGFYYRDYFAVYTPGITFRVLFKVGNPRVNGTYYNYSSIWADLLTSYDVVASGVTSTTSYTYDNGGNPTTITNFNYKGTVYDEAILSWDGRNLKTITVRDNNTTIATITYTYNDQGIRIKKVIVEGETETVTDYYLSGDKVVLEKTNDCVILYTYDVDGSLISFNYDGNEYFYVKDLLGNIIRIIDTNGATLVEYQYDAYGNILHVIDTSGSLALSTINPYTYRGYRYDAEISYYYCNARYYQPLIGRWLNADHVAFLDPEGTGGLNLFGYCGNNPVMYSDPSGHAWWHWAIAVGIVIGIGIAVVCTAGGALYAFGAVMSAMYGVASSSAMLTVLSFAFVGAGMALAGSSMYAAGTASSIQDFADQGNWRTVAQVMGGGLFGALGGYMSYKEQMGEDINWHMIRKDYWKSQGNSDGKATIGSDGYPMVLHHTYGRYGSKIAMFEPMTRTDHIALHSMYGYGNGNGGYNQYYQFGDWWWIYWRI